VDWVDRRIHALQSKREPTRSTETLTESSETKPSTPNLKAALDLLRNRFVDF